MRGERRAGMGNSDAARKGSSLTERRLPEKIKGIFLKRKKGEQVMKRVMVIKTSLRGHGNTARLADEFAEGAREAGHDVEVISLAGKKISFCLGCWGCLKSHRCVIHDDGDTIVQKMKDADVLVFATPIYYYEMSGQMKTLLDRANALYTADYRFRDVYLLTAAESTSPKAPLNAENGLKGWISVFSKARFAGSIFAGGTTFDNTILGRPELQQAREMGRKV